DDNFTDRRIWGILHAKFHGIEGLSVPQRLKIAAQRFFSQDISGTAEDSRSQCVTAHAAVTDELDTVDDKLLLLGGLRKLRGMIFCNLFASCVIKGSREKIRTGR